jgi:2-polyprenyl-3-methyl-5-hydroxy-6-metoxy-1,4-benzoquinol methylase/glycosyltransferase involved in cell wall biosynthesis
MLGENIKMINVNSNEWWEEYFGEKKWEQNQGNAQTFFFGNLLLENIDLKFLDDINKNKYSVCDFGCACGELTKLLYDKLPDCNVCGLDVSSSAVKEAKKLFPEVEFKQENILKTVELFDVIFCSNVLEHFDNPYDVLSKLLNISKKYLIIMVPYREKNLDPSHFYRFDKNDLQERYGDFLVVQRKIIDAEKIENTYWRGEQLLVVMKRIDKKIKEKEGTFAKPEVWDKVSEDYKIEIDESEYQLADEIYNIFLKGGIKPPAKIIELGCGSGHLSASLAMKGYNVTLLDFSEGALKKAKETFSYYKLNGRFIHGDIFNLSNLNEKYDLAWNSGVMEHFSNENLEKIFKSIMSVTKEKFLCLVPNPNCISYLLMRYNLQGIHKWDYGMEYLRTDYLDIANRAGFDGKILGYAASSISKWHFYSTFADSKNAKMYSDMVEENLLPENEAYLIAYEMKKSISNKEYNDVESTFYIDQEKEKIFELSAEKFALQKENAEKQEVISIAEKTKQLVEEKNKLYEEKEQLRNNIDSLKIKIGSLKEENKKLHEGVIYNKEEKERVEQLNYEITALLEPRIKSETVKIQQLLNAPGYCKMSAAHAILGMFKRANAINKMKIVVKVLLRIVGIKKSFHTEDIRMDYKIQNSISNIENIVSSLVRASGHNGIDEKKENINQNYTVCYNTEEVFYAIEPKVSVLLPVYNHADFIESAIESVEQQTYKNWELIIINDGSTDNLLEKLEDYRNDSRIKMFTQDNQRLPNTLTNLHNLASGDFVTWTSADNVMEPRMLEILVKNLIEDPKSVMVFADVAIIDSKGEYLGYGYREMNRDRQKLHVMRLPHATDALDAECDNFINACFMYRMDAVKALKGQYSADLEGLEDYDFWLRLRTFGNITHVCNKEPLYRYRVHENTMSEDLLKNKQEEHKKRSESMITYSRKKDKYCEKNWYFEFKKSDSELQRSLEKINYCYHKQSDKIVYVVEENETRKGLYIAEEKDSYSIKYMDEHGNVEIRSTIYKGINFPVVDKKVRQTNINGLYWEYPAKFVNMRVLGCHCDLTKISIEKTISFIKNNSDKLFSFCAIPNGNNPEAEKRISESCTNVIFMGEREIGSSLYLYASWDMMFIPPMNEISEFEILQLIVGAWNIGKWTMVEKENFHIQILPFVCDYAYDESILAIKKIEDVGYAEKILNDYIFYYSEEGVTKRIIKALNGIGQDIFVERPDFKLVPKTRKFPPERIYDKDLEVPDNLKRGYIAVMVDTLDKGGLEQVVAMLVREFIKRKMNITVFCTNKGGLIADKLRQEKIEVIEFNNNEKAFEKYIKENPPILVNTHFTKNMLSIVKKLNIPMIEVIHNMYVFFGEDDWKIEREREKYFDKMIAVSDLVKETYVKKHGNVKPDKIAVIGNCADENKIYGKSSEFIRSELKIETSSTVFINVSSIDSRKNQLGLLTAFDMFYKTVNSDSYLILVGNCLSEFYNNEVEKYIEELESKDHIIKLNYYQSIADLYNAADVFVMPSYFEGWSIAATEALYCGLPIIHSKCGSAIELVKNGENGILIENPEPDIMNCGKEKLITDMQKRAPENTEELVAAMKNIDSNIYEWRDKRGKISANSLRDFSKCKMIDTYIHSFEKN